MTILNNRIIFTLFSAFAVIYFVLAVIGGINHYSPVPFWDMWPGYIGFYVDVSEGDWSAWWTQHNEHRIVLARILFWLDFKLFNGSTIFLIVMNYLLAGISFLIMLCALQERLPENKDKNIKRILAIVIFCVLFSWMQFENFNWAFQSQFYLAQIIPLGAFLLLYKASISQIRANGYFVLACFTGILALGTMANGVITLPLMFLLALLLRLNKWKIIVLSILSVLAVTIYFYDYHTPGYHSSVFETILSDPLGLIKYLLFYLGSPAFFSTGSRLAACLVSIFFIISVVCFAWKALKYREHSSFELALLTFILYIGGAALATGGGRLIFGVDQALASRYTTPVLMAWSVLLILYAPFIVRLVSTKFHRILVLVLIPLLLLPRQFLAFDSRARVNFERDIAGLALELGIRDETQLAYVFPEWDYLLEISPIAAKNNLSFFDNTLIKDAAFLIGEKTKHQSSTTCLGYVDSIFPIQTDLNYIVISGWLFNAHEHLAPKIIYLLDDERTIIGYALTGQPRPDVAAVIDKKANLSGFKGYLLKNKLGQSIIFQGLQPDCEWQSIIEPVYFQIKEAPSPETQFATMSQVIGNNEWVGSDFDRTHMEGFKVLGSFINSDQDTGSISLQLKRGDSVYFRSGPTAGNQILTMKVNKTITNMLPIALNWMVLEFSDPDLPEQFKVTFSDNGDDFGEWSAIALKEK